MVMGGIAQLFKYHTDLIHQFQFFLPNAAMVYESRVGKEKDSKTNRKEEDEIMKEVRRVGKANIVTRRPIQIQDAIKIVSLQYRMLVYAFGMPLDCIHLR